MNKVFNIDNPVMAFMGKIADLIILNICALICSIPIFTIGASWTAMYYVAVKMVKKEESYIMKDFFKSFKENFKQATLIWLMVLAAVAIFVGDFMIYRAMPDSIPKFVVVALVVIAVFIFSTVLYIFPVLSHFDNTIKNTIKNAFLISMVNLPYTFLLIILFILPFVLGYFVLQILPIIILVGFSGPAFLAGFIWVRIFRKFEPKTEEEGADETDFEGTDIEGTDIEGTDTEGTDIEGTDIGE